MSSIVALVVLAAMTYAAYRYLVGGSARRALHLVQFRSAAPSAGLLPSCPDSERVVAELRVIDAHSRA